MKARFFMVLVTFFVTMVQGVFSALGAMVGATNNLPIANATAYSIRSLHDFHFKKSTMQKLYKNYGDGFNTLDILRSLNRYEMVSNETLTLEEEGVDMRTITVGSSVTLSGSPGGTATFDLHADDLDSSGRYYPRVGFVVQLGNVHLGFIQCRIESIAAGPVFTIKPFVASVTITSDFLATGFELGVFDSAWGVETGQPVGTSKGYWERTFYAQIFKETLTFGGMELAKQKWIEVEGVGFFNKELARVEFALDRQEEAALLMGQYGTNITATSLIDGGTVPVQKNKGIWHWIDELGGEMTYTNAAGPTTEDLDEVADYFESVGITDAVVMVLCGNKMYRRLESMSVEWFVNPTGETTPYGGLTSEFLRKEMGVEGGLTLDITFRAIKKNGIMFVLHKLPAFSNPYQFGISTYKLNDAAILLPLTNVKVRGGVVIPNLLAYYVGINGYSRKRIVASLAGMDGFHNQVYGNPIISQIDGNNTYWLSHVMFPFVEAFKGLIWRRTD